jgi:hypothetical protein
MHRFRIDPLDDIVKMAAHQLACQRDDPAGSAAITMLGRLMTTFGVACV